MNTASDYFGVGVVTLVLGSFVAGGLLYVAVWLGVLVGAIVVAVAQIFLLIGCIAKGVQVANARSVE